MPPIRGEGEILPLTEAWGDEAGMRDPEEEAGVVARFCAYWLVGDGVETVREDRRAEGEDRADLGEDWLHSWPLALLVVVYTGVAAAAASTTAAHISCPPCLPAAVGVACLDRFLLGGSTTLVRLLEGVCWYSSSSVASLSV